MVTDTISTRDAIRPSGQATPTHIRVTKMLLWTFVLCWAFDLRARPEERWLLNFQLLCLGVNCFVIFVAMLVRWQPIALKKARYSYGAIAAFLSVSIVSGVFVWHNPSDRILPNTMPFLVLLSAIYLVDFAKAHAVPIRDILSIVLRAAVVSIVARFVLVLAIRGIDFTTIRYEIVSGASITASAYLLTRMVAGFSARDMVFAVVQAATLGAAVTRTAIFSPLVGALVLFVAARKRLFVAQRVGVLALSLGAIGVVGTATLYLLPGDQLDRWSWRISLVSDDPLEADLSILARRALIDFQMQRLSSSTYGALFGFGIAAEERQTGMYEAIAEQRGALPTDLSAGFGDNTYTSAIYLGGSIGGGALLLLFASWGFTAIRVSRKLGEVSSRREADLLIAPLTVIITLVALLFGAVSDRMGCMYLGLAVGLMLWTETALRTKVQFSKRGRAVRPFQVRRSKPLETDPSGLARYTR